MSTVLAWDTTSERGSIALFAGGRVVEQRCLTSPDGFAHVLFGELETLLARHGIAWGGIDCYAAAAGPGAFTGVRVGLTAAKGLAEAAGKQVAAVSNLAALARLGSGELRAPVIDARRGEIYGGVYDCAGRIVQPEVVMNYDAWVAGLPEGVTIVKEGPALAGAIAQIAAERFAAGEALDPAAIDANYVRRSDAESMWRDPS